MKLSVQSARDMKPGDRLKCHVVRGLELRARGTVKSWQLYYRAATGEQRRPKIGEFPTIPIETARTLALEMLRAVARGEDPSAEKHAKRHAPTVADLCDFYDATHLPNLKPRSREEAARIVKLHVRPRFGSMRTAEVSLLDVNRELAAVTRASGPVAANRTRSVLHKLFEIAEDPANGWRPPLTNPVAKAVRNAEHTRKRKASPDELAAIATALAENAALYPRQVAAIRLALMTGARISELCGARAEHLAGSVVTLDDHKTSRTGDAREIHLPAQAFDELAALPENNSGFLLGGVDRYNVFHVWEKVRAAAGCPDLRIHDLRRTFASVAGTDGKSVEQVGRLLGHKDPRTTMIYLNIYGDASARATQDTADRIAGFMRGK